MQTCSPIAYLAGRPLNGLDTARGGAAWRGVAWRGVAWRGVMDNDTRDHELLIQVESANRCA